MQKECFFLTFMFYTVNDLIDDILKGKETDSSTEDQDRFSQSSKSKTDPNQPQDPDHPQDPDPYEKPKPLTKPQINIWPENEFFRSTYQTQYLLHPSTKLKLKIQHAEQLEFKNIKPNRLCTELVLMDYHHLIKISPLEFVSYPNNCINIEKWMSLNDNIYKLLKPMSPDYLLKCLKCFEHHNDYNAIYIILNVMKSKKLAKNYLNILATKSKEYSYFELRSKIESIKVKKYYILPLDFIIKDIEESNQNLGSKLAGKRFVDVIDFFVDSQTKVLDIKSKRKYQHFIVYRMYKKRDEPMCVIEAEKKEESLGAFYLFL